MYIPGVAELVSSQPDAAPEEACLGLDLGLDSLPGRFIASLLFVDHSCSKNTRVQTLKRRVFLLPTLRNLTTQSPSNSLSLNISLTLLALDTKS